MTKQKFYPDVEPNPDFARIEEGVLSYWQKNKVFETSVDNRAGNDEFVFYDGPPFANGLPHYGHLLTGFVKDIFARYQTIKGKQVERRFGWDCHGLPAEMGAEKELKISGRHQIVEFGIDNFNKQCRTSVMKYSSEWEKYVDRQGRWVDFQNDYKTMDKNYMESVLWAFKQLFDKGYVYESMRVMPYSWACETPLSNFETRMDNAYREKTSKAITVSFVLKDKPKNVPGASVYKLLAWTTTPWTLPSNLALAVGNDIKYSCVIKDDECYIIASSSLGSYKKELAIEEDSEFREIKGSDLVGLSYEPLLPYFKDNPDSFKVLAADFVEEGDGTGVVHIAPGFGEDDFDLCKNHNIPLVCPVDNAGKFTDEVKDFSGMQVFEANDGIIIKLKEQGSWLKTEQYIHNYPHCWRTDTPLIYKALPSWYVEVTKFKDRMVELNGQINWIPDHIQQGLFGKWLENARDWSISRNRFWGAPIPVWKSNNPQNKKYYVFGSIKELEEFFGVEVQDLHRPFIDELTAPDPEDSKYTLTRVEDVFDCWFESGSMPFAQVHYPFENKEWFESHFPADFIVEYVAQTRGWFYTLMVLSTAIFDKPPFLNCICHGVVLDDKGQKLSKRLNNYADPMDVFSRFGADAMRWVMISAPIMHGGELLIDKEGNMVRDAVRLVLKPVWNAYNFFTLYANADLIKGDFVQSKPENLMDRYILAKCSDAILQIEKYMDSYDTPSACRAVEGFFEILNNWYIRRNKERFWKSEKDQDKQQAYDTLYTVLNLMCRAISPLLPFLTEEIWQGINPNAHSVHLEEFPDVSKFTGQEQLIADMDRVQDACNAALSIRSAENLRVRQPLSSLTIVASGATGLGDYVSLIQDEVNVKEVKFSDDVNLQAEYKLQINFPALGKRLPEKMKQIIPASKKGEWKLLEGGKVEIIGEVLTEEECSLQLIPKADKGAQSLSSNDALVILDLEVTEELKVEGVARDLVRMVQQSRKEANLNITDRIKLGISADNDNIKAAMKNFDAYITEQTLAVSLDENAESYEHKFEQALEGKDFVIGFSVVA